MSSRERLHLSLATYVEPLVNGWAAWPSLLSPLPASLHLQRYQLPLLRSFVDNPAVHVEAARSPELVCGPFCALAPHAQPQVDALLRATEATLQANVDLATEFMAFQQWLVEHAAGLSMEEHYAQVPPALRGCVELVYDYWHRPSVKVIEAMLYRSPLYRPDLQALRVASLTHDRGRAYFLNTPRLHEEDGRDVHWQVPFSDERVDAFCRLDVHGATEGEIRELLGLCPTAPLRHLLSQRTTTRPSWDEPQTRIRYFGHACVLVERGGESLLVDPFASAVPTAGGDPRFSFDDLPPRIDYLLVTHGHQDHFCLETLLRLRHRTGCLVVPHHDGTLYGDVSLRLLAERVGFRHVIELAPFDSLPFAGGRVIAVPFLGEHADVGHSKTAYVVRVGRRQMLFAADSDCLDPALYERVRAELGTIDTVFVGMESEGAVMSFAYGTLLPGRPTRAQEESRRQHGCNAARALRLCEALGATEVYNYAMGLEPWLYHVLGLNVDSDSAQWRESEAMLTTLRSRGIRCDRLSGPREWLCDEDAPAPAAVTPGSPLPEFQFD